MAFHDTLIYEPAACENQQNSMRFNNLKKQRLVRGFCIAVLATIIFAFVVSCGKKSNPTLKSFEKPEPVRAVKVEHRGNEMIVSWPYPSSARQALKGFIVEKAEDTGGTAPEFKKIAVLSPAASQYADDRFSSGKKYLYKVRPVNSREVSGDDSPVVSAAPAGLPARPQGLAYRITDDTVEIYWQKGPGRLFYNIYKSDIKDKIQPTPLNSAPLKEPFFKDAINPSASFYYHVKALLGTDIVDEGLPSDTLVLGPEAFVPAGPSGLNFVPTPSKVFLLWKEAPESWVKGYRIYRKRSGEDSFLLIGDSVAPAFNDREPLTRKTFYYVTALGPVKESAPSNSVEADPLVED
ncbi:MAG: fibronectin type III domain-containing protein [Nitrospirae bacterium]|nr:MAG: fibronectin type III domain-containing protein [Nitrospirota bacterium]